MKVIVTIDVGAVPEGAGMLKVDEVRGLLGDLEDPSAMMLRGYRHITVSYEA